MTHSGRRPGQGRPGPQREPRPPGPLVVALVGPVGRADAHVGQQSRKQGPVDAVGWRLDVVEGHAEVTHQLPQLATQVLPLAHPQVVEVLRPAHPPELVAGHALLLVAQVAPQGEVPEEVRGPVHELGMRGVRGGAVLLGPLPRILHRQPGDDDQDLAQAAEAVRLDQHPRQPRVHRESGHRRARPRSAAGRGRRSRARVRRAPAAAARRRRPADGPAGPGTGSPRPGRGAAPPSAG